MSLLSLSELLKKLRTQNPAFGKRWNEAEAVGRWEKIVGPQISKHTRPIQVKDGVLWVEVDHPIWKSELHHQKNQILAKLNAELPQPILDLLWLDPRTPKPQEG